jgi:hypothetical protein
MTDFDWSSTPETNAPSAPCWVCGAPADLGCDTCQRALCGAHTFIRRQGWDCEGWDGVDILCVDHAEARPGFVITHPLKEESV